MKSSVRHPHPAAKPHRLAVGVACVLASMLAAPAVSAQSGGSEASDLDTVVVTGIRGSLQSSMNLKRDSVGVVDGIIAEDIGKFPDTNLAESLQRISGVSIDRTDSGEGSKVTVRGVGPDFNLVLLNGRQMPASNLGAGGSGISNSRAFDFANIASEAVSELEVYKTVHADMPTGGIGATLNIKTVRPLDKPGLHAQLGVKGVMDQSVDNLPRSYKGKSLTPEISGIFSDTWADGRFGVALTASYQERDSGYSRAANERGWRSYRGDDDSTPFHLPQPHEMPTYGLYDIENQPGAGDIYSRPVDLIFSVTGVQRQRRNGQAVIQFAPVENVTATLDYTYALNKVQQQSNRMWVTFEYLPGFSSWTDGPVAGPIVYQEDPDLTATPRNSRLSMGAGYPSTRSELKSLGFNLDWKVNDALDLAFDWHHSRSEIIPDSPYGTNGYLGITANVRRKTTVDFSSELPIFSYELAPGISELGPEHALLASSVFQGSYNWSDIKQGQLSGTFRFADYQALNFGVARTEVSNRTAASRSLRTAGGGLGTPGDYADDIFQVEHIGQYFDRFSAHDDPDFSDRFLLFDFERLRQRALEMGVPENLLRITDNYRLDVSTLEKSSSAWMQWRNTFDLAIPLHVTAGVRYEKTEIISPSSVQPPIGNVYWPSFQPEFRVDLGTDPVAENFTGEYDYWLPSLDARADLLENLVLRASYGKSIGRAGWNDLQGGLTVNGQLQVAGGAGDLGNPGLLPLESKNFDLSLEWYYSEGSYVSLGYFRKKIKNFISQTRLMAQTPFPDVHTPVGGEYWNNAIDPALGGCLDVDYSCIRSYIFSNYADVPGSGVVLTGYDSQGLPEGTITGRASDPVAWFDLSTPVNQRSDTLDGFELNLQHMFGGSGFGVAFNYTKVDSGLVFDNARIGDQYPMVGLSDSANLVAFYDKNRWQVRLAYNWRDEFLSSAVDDAGANPQYTEKYGQLDANVTWSMNERLSLFVEGINLTDETQRIHNRHRNMLVSATQTGPRYMFGLRYKF